MILIIQYVLSSMILPVELLTAILLYASQLQRRRNFWIRAISMSAATLILPILLLAGVLFILPIHSGRDLLISLAYAAFSYTAVACFALACCQISPWEAFYCATCAYLTQHFAHCFRHFFFPQSPSGSFLAFLPIHALLYAAVYAAAYFLFARQLPTQGHFRIDRIYSLWTTLCALAIALVLGANAQNLEEASAPLYQICLLYAMVCCFLTLWTQAGQQKRLTLQHELDVQQQLWLQQKAQYEMSAENVELINRKCHDLKYQIAALKQISDQTQREESIHSLEQAVMIYDSVVKTGNHILDTVLTEKSLLCEARGITLTCVADGACLEFMDAVDIYTIFGNALDNAIESVSKLGDPEQRIITVTVFSRVDMVFLQLENYCSPQPAYDGDLPGTSKEEDVGYHGFGLKSIRYTAEKYGGFLTVQNDDEIFLFRVTIPLYQS